MSSSMEDTYWNIQWRQTWCFILQGIWFTHLCIYTPRTVTRYISSKAKEIVFIGYESNTKGYCFWLSAQHRVFISTHVLFDEIIFSFCSRSQTDGPAPISVEEERPTAYDKPSTEETGTLSKLLHTNSSWYQHLQSTSTRCWACIW